MTVAAPSLDFRSHFTCVEDPRIDRTKYHALMDILFISVAATMAGADGPTDIEEFTKEQLAWCRKFVPLKNGVPSHDTIGRVLAVIKPDQFQKAFLDWVASFASECDENDNEKNNEPRFVPIDGKTLRGSKGAKHRSKPLHLVSAWATTNRLVLGQQKVDEKSNEITAIPELLRALDLQGCIVTIDAMGCQTAIADLIIEGEGDYLLSLKGNQSNLHDDVVLLFDDLIASDFTAYAYDYAVTVDKNHGRIETRRCWLIDYPSLTGLLRGADNWRGLTTLVKVRSERRIGDKLSLEERYFIASYHDTALHILQ